MKIYTIILVLVTNLNTITAQNTRKSIEYKTENLKLVSVKEIPNKTDSTQILPKIYFENTYVNNTENQFVLVEYSVINSNKIKNWPYNTNLFHIENIKITNLNVQQIVERESITFDDKNGNTFIIYISNPELPKEIKKEILTSEFEGTLFSKEKFKKFTFIILEIKMIESNRYVIKLFQSPKGNNLDDIIKYSETKNYLMNINKNKNGLEIVNIENYDSKK